MELLAGFKVVEVSAYAYVPAAGGVLAHWGADVIKVESPNAPDPMRFFDGSLDPGRSSNMFKHYSRGKRSIAVDLGSEDGRELIYELAEQADVFLTSYLPETRRKLRIDVADIRAANPNIVYARGSGYGPRGPDANRPGYDLISWWCRGSLAQSAMDVWGGSTPPMMVGHGDGMSGMTLAGGICAALLHRERTGETQVVDGSLLGTAMWFNGPALIASQFAATREAFAPSRSAPTSRAEAPPSAPSMPATQSYYLTKDSRFIYFFFLGDPDRDFVDLCQHFGRPELGEDPRFGTSRDRFANRDELRAIFTEVLAQRTFDEWKSVLSTAKGAWCPVQSPEDVYTDPQTTANGYLSYVDYPGGGLNVPIPAILFEENGGEAPPAPDFAAHTEEILAQLAVPAERVANLRERNVIR